jgi:hypothetical protein
MVSWQEFADSAPDLEELGRERLDGPEVVLVGTTRKDGTARISPVEPYIVEGELYLGMMGGSMKARDLFRDPRILVHSIVTDRMATGGDFKVRGRAVDVTDPGERELFAQAVLARLNWRPPEPYHLFKVDIEEVSYITFTDDAMTVRRWPGGARGGDVGRE